MPAKYEALKSKFQSQGESPKAAETSAAKVFNATRKPGQPSLNAYVKAEQGSRPRRPGPMGQFR